MTNCFYFNFFISKKDQIHECFCWKNVRPYLAKKNRNKYDKIDQRERKIK